MFSALLQRIQHFVFRTARILFMTNSTGDPFLFQNAKCSDPVRFSPAQVLNQVQILTAEDVHVYRIEWCKRDSHPFHEFLVFFVQQSTGQQRSSYILAERNSSDEKEVDIVKAQEKSTPTEGDQLVKSKGTSVKLKNVSHILKTTVANTQAHRPSSTVGSLASSTSSSDSLSSRANDIIYFSYDDNKTFVFDVESTNYCLAEYKISGNYLSLPQLAVIIYTINQRYPNYRLFSRQCYWFAFIVMEMIKIVCKPNHVVEDPRDKAHLKRGHFGNNDIRSLNSANREQEIDDLIARYHVEWQKFSRDITERRQKEIERKERVSLRPVSNNRSYIYVVCGLIGNRGSHEIGD